MNLLPKGAEQITRAGIAMRRPTGHDAHEVTRLTSAQEVLHASGVL